VYGRRLAVDHIVITISHDVKQPKLMAGFD